MRIKEFDIKDENGEKTAKLTRYETTVGRALLSEILPAGLSFNVHQQGAEEEGNLEAHQRRFPPLRPARDGDLRRQADVHRLHAGDARGLVDRVDDMLVPPQKDEIIGECREGSEGDRAQYTSGLVTQGERYNKVVDIWGRAGDLVAKAMMEQLGDRAGQATGKGKRVSSQESFNSIYMMADSGARGSAAQIRQLAGMRGLMAKPDGSIIETPITANFREGSERAAVLHLDARRAQRPGGYGVEDGELGLPHAPPGRRDAGSGGDRGRLRHGNGVAMKALVEGGEVVEALRERILGRVITTDVLNPETQDVLHPIGHLLDEDAVDPIEAPGIDEVKCAHAAHLRDALRLVREVLRPRPGPRRAGQRRRSGRRDRRAVDRRAGHAADDAHVPHRRRGVAHRGGSQVSKQVQRRGALRQHDALRDQRQGRAGRDLAQRRSHDR